MKKRRFADGGETEFSPEQEAWLGKADRTDPYILARMRRAVPDKPKLATVEARQFTPVKQETPVERVAASDTDSDIADMKRSASSADDTADMKRGAMSVKASRPAAAPVRSKPYSGTGGSGGGRGPTAEELANYQAAQKPTRRKLSDLMPSEDAIQKGLEIGLPAGAGASMLARLAKSLAGRTTKPAAEAAQQALAAPVKRIGFDKAGAKAAERGARAETRQAEMLKENARRSGLREDAPEATKRAVRERLGGDDWSLPMKKGGSVQKYANGGAVKAKGWGMARGCRAAKIV